MSPSSSQRSVVVIGGSAGALDALSAILSNLPADFSAALLIVLHVGATSHLAGIMARRCALPVAPAVSGEAVESGRVYVAVPDHHLLVHDSHVLLRRGPRENQARPAIDPLFRTAAVSFPGRVIGVLLSGGLSDGTAGLRAIKRCGGLAVVQDPDDAAVPGMPRHALRHIEIDHVCRASDIAGLLAKLVVQPAAAAPDIPLDIRIEAAIAVQENSDMDKVSELGKPSPFTCPECHGALWEIEDGPLLRYRCHIGHAYSAETALAAQNRDIQQMLESLLRANRERAALAWRMAEKERQDQRHKLASQLERRAREYDEGVQLMREMMAATEAPPVTNPMPGRKVPANGEEEG